LSAISTKILTKEFGYCKVVYLVPSTFICTISGRQRQEPETLEVALSSHLTFAKETALKSVSREKFIFATNPIESNGTKISIFAKKIPGKKSSPKQLRCFNNTEKYAPGGELQRAKRGSS
jgi:hypothetical protein